MSERPGAHVDSRATQMSDRLTRARKRSAPRTMACRIALVGALLLCLAACSLCIVYKALFTGPIPNVPLPAEVPEAAGYHAQDYATAIRHVPIPQHPYMAPAGGNNMHCDAYMSDTHGASGPLGNDAQVASRTQGFGGYGTIAFDGAGRLIGVYSNGRGFQLEMMNPYTLEELASYDLPPRPWYWFLQGVLPWEYLGAGTYFYLDDQYRAVVPTTDHALLIVQAPDPPQDEEFELVRSYDLAAHVVPVSWPKRDSIAWVLPDWSGEYYWYATTEGMVGTVNVESGAVHTMQLAGEVIENSFAVGEDGVYILSDHALYRFSQDGSGIINVDWRTEYDRGPGRKPGHITRGSGTSVTLMGDPEGLVVITDNAEPRISVLFLRRSDGSVVCSVPVFEEGKSGTDISTAGFEQANDDGHATGTYSVLVENNWGHHVFPRSYPEPGLTRVDTTRGDDGTYSCQQMWASGEKGIGVFKLSLGNGLAYMYWRGEGEPLASWYLTAVDFQTGETVYKKLVGIGPGYNNWAGALFLHPDGGTAYSTTLFGLVMIRDGAP
jgi:hypothetical protein